MQKMIYKNVVWPQNPHTYKEEYIRQPHFHTEGGTTYYDGMGDMQRIITGSGTFFGETAYEDFGQLVALFEDGGAGILMHPLLGTRYCHFTGLGLTQEPRENYVSYTFQFTGALNNGEVPR